MRVVALSAGDLNANRRECISFLSLSTARDPTLPSPLMGLTRKPHLAAPIQRYSESQEATFWISKASSYEHDFHRLKLLFLASSSDELRTEACSAS